MSNTSVIRGNDDSSVVDGLDSIEDTLVNGFWVNFQFFFLGTDIERTETSETVVVDCCDGRMGDAPVENFGFGGAFFGVIVDDRRRRRAGVRSSTV